MIRRRLLVAAAVGAFVVGVGAAIAPGALASGGGRLFVGLVAAAALLQGIRVIRARRRRPVRWTALPDPEPGAVVPAPGEDLDAVLAAFVDERDTYHAGTRVRAELREAAVAVLTRYWSHSEATARERVADGAWTDDDYAASFVLDGPAPEPPLLPRVRALLGGESAYARGLRRAVAAVADAAGLPEARADGRGGGGTLDALRRRFGDASRGDRRRGVVADGRGAGRSEGAVRGGRADDHVRTAGAPRRAAVAAPDEGDEAVRTGHWYGVGAAALLAVGLGTLARSPSVLLVGAVGIAYAAYARSGSRPAPALSVERDVDDPRPAPGETVAVTATVANEGDRTVPDLRLVDGVPEGLPVAAGSPRLGTALRPGESATIEYEVTARRGVHEFGPPRALARDLPEAVEAGPEVAADAPAIECVPPLSPLSAPVPLRRRTAGYAGPVETESGGEGVEFHATREYRPGDPMNRVDWNRHARTGDLATLEFREERTATVVLVVDARPSAYVAPRPGAEHAVDRATDGAGRAFATVLAAGNRAGVAALGDRDCWLAPGRGAVQRTRARELLTGTPPSVAGDGRRDPAGLWERELYRRLPADAQVVLFSPLVDGGAAAAARKLEARGHPVVVVSPDPTVADAPSRQLARVARQVRVTDLREAGVPVVEWAYDEPLAVALARFAERWSR